MISSSKYGHLSIHSCAWQYYPRWQINWDELKFKNQMAGILGFSLKVEKLEQVKTEHINEIKISQYSKASMPTIIDVAPPSPLHTASLFCPKHFQEEKPEVLEEFFKNHQSVILLFNEAGILRIAHLNMHLLKDKDKHSILSGTIPYEYQLSSVNATAIILGPHTYISPSWYSTPYSVPTWNYATVHAHGILTFTGIENEGPGQLSRLELKIDKVEGKFKLNQNKVQKDRMGVINGLSTSDDPEDHAVCEMMKSHSAF